MLNIFHQNKKMYNFMYEMCLIISIASSFLNYGIPLTQDQILTQNFEGIPSPEDNGPTQIIKKLQRYKKNRFAPRHI